MNIKRITRLLQLLQLLQAGNGADASGLAEACGVGKRTVFRDLDALKQAGVPLAFDKERKFYFIPGAYFLPPTNFTPAEALSLVALAAELGQGDRTPFCEAAHSAALKLEGSLPMPLRQELRLMRQAIHIRPRQLSRLNGHQTIYQLLVDALAARHAVAMTYDSFTEGDVIETTLHPYQMLFCRHSWYGIGHSSLHAEIRTFNVGRILSATMLKERFVTPRSFRLERYLGNAWEMIPEPGRDKKVLVRFKPMVARNVAEVIWHKTQQTTFRADGSLDFSVRVSGLKEISWWILGYGDQAEVFQPAQLRRMVAQRANNMAVMYNGKG
jgi:predicted DNA-binding transcriptional regulator YafY